MQTSKDKPHQENVKGEETKCSCSPDQFEGLANLRKKMTMEGVPVCLKK